MTSQDSPDVKGADVDISGPRVSGPDFDLKAKKDDHSDSDDDEHSWKFKGPKLPSWKFGKEKSGKPPKVSGDVDIDADIERPDLDISGGVDSPDVKGADVDISGPRVSGPDFDLKANKGDHSDSDDDEHSWKFKGPKLPRWKFGKGKSGKPPKVSGDVNIDADIERPDLDISGKVDSPDVKGADVDISGPRVSGPDFDLKAKKDDHSDSDDDEHSWKFKGPKLPSWKFGKGKSGKSPKVSGDVDIDADIERPDLDISGGVDSPDVKGADVDISGPRVSGPDFDLKAKKDDHSDSDDDEHSWKFKGPKLPSWKFGKGKSGKPPKVSGDVDIDADIERPNLDISGGVDNPDVKGADVDISGPRVSGPDFDLKANKGDHSDSDDDEHSWKFKGPKLPSWKFGKGKSGKPPKVSGDVNINADIERTDLDISGGVDSPDVKGADVDISGPRVSGPDFDLKAKKDDHSDSDDDEHSWKFKGPKLPSWKFGKGKSGKPPKVSGDVDIDADIERADLDISGKVDSPDVKGADVDISGPRVSGPDFDLKAKKDDHSDSDDDEHSWKFKGPKLPSWKFGKGKSGKPPKVSGDVDIDADIERPDLDISGGVDSLDVKGADVDISGPRVRGPDFDLKAKKDDHSDSDDDEHSWKFKGPKLPSWKFGKGKSGKPPKVSGDVDIDADIERPDLDISGGVDSPDVKGADVDISGPRVSGPDFDLKANKGDHSDSDDDEHSWKFKGPKLPRWKFGKGKSGKPPKVSGDVNIDADIERTDLDISGGVDSPDVKGADVDISGPRVSGPDFDLKAKKDDHSDSDDDEHSWKFKGPKLPSWKFGKGKSGKPPKVSGDVNIDADIERTDLDISGKVDSPDVKGADVDISGPRVSGPDFDLKAKKDDHSDSDDDEHSWKFKGPKLPSWKFGKGKSGKPPKVSGDVDIDADIERPDLDISGGVDSPDVKGADVDISGPRVRGPDFDLKAKKDDHSDSDDDEHSWKFKGPKLPSWKFGKGKSGKLPKVSGDVDIDADIERPDLDISGGVDSPNVKGADVDISGPRVSGPDFDLKAKKDDHSDSDDDEHSWKFKGPKLPSWKFGKGKSGKPPKVSGDVDIDADIERPDLDISGGVDSPDVKGADVDISGPRVSGPDFDLKANKGDHSDSDDDEHSWKFKGPKLPSWKFGKGKSGKPPKVSGDVNIDADIERPDLDISGGVDSPDVKGADVDISGPRVRGPDFDLKAKKDDHSDSDDDEHSWKFKGPKLPSWKFGKGKSGKPPKVSRDVDIDADIERADLDISGKVENPDVKGADVDISGPRVSGPDFDLKAKKDDHSDSDDDEHSWKFKGPKLPSWKFGKGNSGKPPKVSGDVDIDADIERPDLDISGGVDNPDVKGADVDISGPRVSGPDFDLKAKKDDHSDSDDDEHSWKFKGPKLPSWKFGKGKSGKSPKVSGDVDIDADIERPDLDISGKVGNPDVKGADVDISGPRVSGPDFDLKAKKDDHSDSDDDEHSWKFKGPKLPSWKFGKGKSGKSPKVSGDVDIDADIERPDIDISGEVDSPDVKGPDVDMSCGPDFDLKAKKGDHSGSHEEGGWKFGLPEWRFGKEKSGKPPKVAGDMDVNTDIKRPDLDISGGVDKPGVKGPDGDLSGPRLSGREMDLKSKKGDHSGSDDDGGWKFGLPDWKIGKGISRETPKGSGNVSIDGNVKTPGLDISVPRMSGPDIDLKAMKSIVKADVGGNLPDEDVIVSADAEVEMFASPDDMMFGTELNAPSYSVDGDVSLGTIDLECGRLETGKGEFEVPLEAVAVERPKPKLKWPDESSASSSDEDLAVKVPKKIGDFSIEISASSSSSSSDSESGDTAGVFRVTGPGTTLVDEDPLSEVVVEKPDILVRWPSSSSSSSEGKRRKRKNGKDRRSSTSSSSSSSEDEKKNDLQAEVNLSAISALQVSSSVEEPMVMPQAESRSFSMQVVEVERPPSPGRAAAAEAKIVDRYLKSHKVEEKTEKSSVVINPVWRSSQPVEVKIGTTSSTSRVSSVRSYTRIGAEANPPVSRSRRMFFTGVDSYSVKRVSSAEALPTPSDVNARPNSLSLKPVPRARQLREWAELGKDSREGSGNEYVLEYQSTKTIGLERQKLNQKSKSLPSGLNALSPTSPVHIPLDESEDQWVRHYKRGFRSGSFGQKFSDDLRVKSTSPTSSTSPTEVSPSVVFSKTRRVRTSLSTESKSPDRPLASSSMESSSSSTTTTTATSSTVRVSMTDVERRQFVRHMEGAPAARQFSRSSFGSKDESQQSPERRDFSDYSRRTYNR